MISKNSFGNFFNSSIGFEVSVESFSDKQLQISFVKVSAKTSWYWFYGVVAYCPRCSLMIEFSDSLNFRVCRIFIMLSPQFFALWYFSAV